MPDSLHEIAIDAPRDAVYAAWTTQEGLESWWTADVTPAVDTGVYVFKFDGGAVEFHFRIAEELPGDAVRWRGIEAPKMPDEWVGTEIHVELSDIEDGKTRMLFGHTNWQRYDGAYRTCNTTWGELMYRLKDHCEGNGRGPLFKG